MKLGLIGLPKSGKTTIFNALTGAQAEVTAYATGKIEPNLASVPVDDERVTKFAELYRPKKTVHATIDISDFVGTTGEKASALSPAMLQLIRNNDALAMVVRNFENDLEGAAKPAVDIAGIEDEFVLADLIIVENRLERIEKGAKKGQKTPQILAEEKLMHRLAEQLNNSLPVRNLEYSAEEKQLLTGFQFLTLKPVMVILNSDESNFGKNQYLLDSIAAHYPAIECAGTFEMELAGLDEEEKSAFMADMGITESSRSRMTRTAYELLGYISFFTVGEDEVRAWNIFRGDTALTAAGTIHSDLARGFIRAECFSYADFVACGSTEKGVKERGKFRLEGKEYVVADGDVLNIRFNV